MKAIFQLMNEYFEMELEDAIGIPGQNIGLMVTGYTRDQSYERAIGFSTHRQELDNLPQFYGFLGPMWDGDHIRYETKEYYNTVD